MTNITHDWTNLFMYQPRSSAAAQIVGIAMAHNKAKYRYMAQTTKEYDLIDFGTFPAMIRGNFSVGGDVYLVSPEVMYELDSYEESRGLYTRNTIVLWGSLDDDDEDAELAQAYIFNDDEDIRLLHLGLYSDSKLFGGIHMVSKTVKSWWD
jgi:gamma-glutamylcyclotransferase (GGCT)/AIG2-like uncharacterized protein YtfP